MEINVILFFNYFLTKAYEFTTLFKMLKWHRPRQKVLFYKPQNDIILMQFIHKMC
jgi:hypothetical protein